MQPKKKFLTLLFTVFTALPAFTQVIGGIDNPPKHPQLQGTADFNCVLDTLFTTVDPWPAGIAKQGDGFWVSGNTYDTLYKTDYDGHLLASIGLNLGKSSIGGDLYYDGSALWAVAEQKAILYKFNPGDGALLDTFLLPANYKIDPNSYGITGDGTRMWHSEYAISGDTSRIYTLNPADGMVESYFDVPAIILGIKYLGNGELLGASPFPTSMLYKININTGALVDSVVLCFSYPTSVETSHDSVFVVSSKTGSIGDRKVYLIDAPGLVTATPGEPQLPDAIAVFPNPARDNVTIIVDPALLSGGTGYLSILDPLGKQVKTVQDAFPAGKNQTSVSVAGLLPGVYLIRVEVPGQAYAIKKLVKL